MKKIIFAIALLLPTFVFAEEGHCDITEENAAEWEEAERRIEAIIKCPELIEIFELMDSEVE